MEALLIYQFKVAVLVAALFGGYRLLLGRETFHRFNRLVLITIALLSFVLPFFHITRPAVPLDLAVMEDNVQTSAPDNLLVILLVLYGAGVLFVLIKKGISVWAMSRIIRKGRYADRNEGVDVIESDQIPGPLNWMRFIVMPHDWLEKENASVWKHENLHAHRWHSLDLLMADVMTAFQWFNPVMILLRKEFELIHEFEADRAVIESGADLKEYKLMLVTAVAANRGMAMTSWLKQSNLKKRIDMMDKKQSNGWNRLRVLFVPAIAYFFLFATANVSMAADQNNRWPVFEDSKTWIYQDGTCKVRTFDGVESTVNVGSLADYLSNHQGFKINRMTLMYTYPIEGLAQVQPLAESLAAKGIRVSVANNNEMLTQMNMPEYRAAKICDLGGGQYRFELNCNNLGANLRHEIVGVDLPYQNPSITGDVNLMAKWIGLFDGHGVALYPDRMSAADADILSKATWESGKEQFSIVRDGKKGRVDNHEITIVPMNYSIAGHYPGMDAKTAAAQMLSDYTEKYTGKGLYLKDPKVLYNPEENWLSFDVVNADDEFIILFKYQQTGDRWVKGLSECEIEVDGKWIKETKNEGMDGFQNGFFWAPTWGYVYQTVHFPALPKDVKTVNFRNKALNNPIKKIQVTADASPFEKVRSLDIDARTYLQTTHVNHDLKDEFMVERVDFSEKETTVYCSVLIRADPSFPGHIGSDFRLALKDGPVLNAIRIEGVPVNKDFDRQGDWVSTPFQVVFIAVSPEQWSKGAPVLSGTVCHEPISVKMLRTDQQEGEHACTVESIAPGKYEVSATIISKQKGENFYGMQLQPFGQIEVTADGTLIIKTEKKGLIPDGKYKTVWKDAYEESYMPRIGMPAPDGGFIPDDSKRMVMTFKVRNREYVFDAVKIEYDKDSKAYFGLDYRYNLTSLRTEPDEDGDISGLTLTPIE